MAYLAFNAGSVTHKAVFEVRFEGSSWVSRLMMFLSLITVLLAPLCAEGVQDALRVLRSPDASYPEIRAAGEAIAQASADQGELCSALIGIWAEGTGATRHGRGEALRVACLRADENRAASIVARARELFSSASAVDRETGRRVYGAAAILAERMRDPEPLLRLLAERGCVSVIRRLVVKPELRDRYLIDGLRVEEADCAPHGESLFCDLSPAGLAGLPALLPKSASDSIRTRAFDVVLRTLVDAEDAGVEPFLCGIQDDPRLTDAQRGRVRAYLVKLRCQHSTADLVRVLRSDSDLASLKYAAWRLLWLKCPLAEILSALRENPTSGVPRGAAAQVAALFSAKPDPEQGVPPQWYMSWLAFDAEELRSVCHDPNDLRRTMELMQEYTLPMLRKRASAESQPGASRP